jgi:TatD DNase family protein
MNLTDTHTHLYDEQFDADRTAMVQRAIGRGITTMLIPNVELATVDGMLAVCAEFPENCFPMMGLHPCSVKEDWENEMQLLEQHARYNKYYGIGEIGIDLYWDKSTYAMQRSAFIYQMMLAKELKLPVSIHSREATAECIEAIKEHKLFTGGVFHCWAGTLEQAMDVIEMGFAIGIGGVLTFKNSNLPAVVKEIDIRHIVLETDAPYLAPMPYRGKRNEPSYIFEIAQKLAEVKGISLKEVADITTKNALRIFKLENII